MKPTFSTKQATDLWESIISTYELEGFQLHLLELACQSMDEIQTAKEVIDAEGRYVIDRFGQTRHHPAHKVSCDHRALFLKYMRELNLEAGLDDPKPPRLR